MDCYEALVSLACQTAFPQCLSFYQKDINRTVLAPSKPCKSMCELTNNVSFSSKNKKNVKIILITLAL